MGLNEYRPGWCKGTVTKYVVLPIHWRKYIHRPILAYCSNHGPAFVKVDELSFCSMEEAIVYEIMES